MRVRSVASGVPGLLFAVALPLASAAAAGVRVDLDPSGRGAFFSGFLEENGVRVEFESRETATGAESRIFTAAGEALTEVVVDEVRGSLEYRVGGALVSDPAGTPGPDAYRRAFDRPEAALVAERLWITVTERGLDPSSRAMAILAANLVGYEMVPVSRLLRGKETCLGCCGPSCWGCTGCYTRACLAHDLCVMNHGMFDSRCNELVTFAALSAWCCRGVDLGKLC